MPARLTLDTNVPFNWWAGDEVRAVYLERLLDLAADGEVELVVTRYLVTDVPREPLASRVRELPALGVDIVGGVFTIGPSELGGDDGLASGDFLGAVEQLRRESPSRKLPQPVDFDHLHAHLLHGRDEFLTWDGPILGLAPWLSDRLGIVVTRPDHYRFEPS